MASAKENKECAIFLRNEEKHEINLQESNKHVNVIYE